MDNGTKLRTALAIATSLNMAVLATDVAQFGNEKADFIYKIISLVLNFIIVALTTYYNNDYTETAATYTGLMRQQKAEEDPEYEGERFFDDIVEDEVTEDEE